VEVAGDDVAALAGELRNRPGVEMVAVRQRCTSAAPTPSACAPR
jgi:hypothetical protein